MAIVFWQSRAGSITFMTGFLTFMSIGGFPSFVEDLKVSGYDDISSYLRIFLFTKFELINLKILTSLKSF